MFQLADIRDIGLLAQLLRFAAISGCGWSSRVLEVSIFSYSSEILEKRLERRHGGLEIAPAYLR